MTVSGLLYLHHKTGSSPEIQISMTFFWHINGKGGKAKTEQQKGKKNHVQIS